MRAEVLSRGSGREREGEGDEGRVAIMREKGGRGWRGESVMKVKIMRG